MYKWVEKTTLPNNDAKVLLKIVKKNIFSIFKIPRTIISNGGSHFVNHWFKNMLAKYGVRNKVDTTYGQLKVSYCEIMHIFPEDDK